MGGSDAPRGTDGAIQDSGPAAADADGGSVYRQTVLADHPVGYWRLREAANAPTAVDEEGSYSAPYSLGVTPGAVASPIVGDPGKAAEFDGTGSILIGSVLPFDGDGGLAAYSFEAWVNLQALDAPAGDTNCFPTILGQTGAACPTGPGNGYLLFSGGCSGLVLETSRLELDCGLSFIVASQATRAFAQWTHVVTTWDGATLVLYISGQPYEQTADGSAIASSAGATLQIGGYGSPPGQFWLGALSEVAVYDYALDAGRVCDHYSVGMGMGLCP
jgi:hypothetical protein